jgi:thiol:disulfide interchange protein DsbC
MRPALPIFFRGYSMFNIFRRALVGTLVAASFGFAAVAPVAAQTDTEATVRAAVNDWLKGRYKVDGVRSTPLAGIYEVQIGGDLIYVDAKGQHAFVEGQLIELKSNRSLTQARIEELNAIDFKSLPFNLAIKQVIGKGTRVVAVFEDPNCPHCRNLRRDLLNVPDVTIYTFPYPVLGADSDTKSRQAWCAPDRVKAWNELVVQNKIPANSGSCDTPIPKVLELGRTLRVTGTPTIFFQNGKRVPGGVPASRLNTLIDEYSKPS